MHTIRRRTIPLKKRITRALHDHIFRRIIKNAGIVFSGNSLASVLNISAFAIMAKTIGPKSLALLVLAQTYALIINDIVNIQTWESMLKFGSIKADKDKMVNIIKTNIVLDVGSAIIAFVFAFLLAGWAVSLLNWDPQLRRLASIYSLSILFNVTTLTIGIPRLFDKFFAIAKINVSVACINLACIVTAVYFSQPLIVYLYILLFVDILRNCVLIIMSWFHLRNRFDPSWWKKKWVIDRHQVRFIWWTNLRTIIRIPVRHLDMVIISTVMPIKTVGLYKVYKELAGFLTRFSDPVSQAIYPEFTNLLGNNQANKSVSLIKRTMVLLCVISALLTFPALFMSKFVVGHFFGAENLTQIGVLYAMLLLFGIKLVTSPINSLFIAAGFAKSSTIIVLITNTIYSLTAFAFSILSGIYGIVAAFALQSFLNTGLKVYLLKKFSGKWGEIVR